MSYLWKGKSKTRKHHRKRPSGYTRKRPPDPAVTVTVEIVGQTEKVILIKNNRGETAWIPRYWIIKKKELSEHTWQIETFVRRFIRHSACACIPIISGHPELDSGFQRRRKL